MLALHSELVEEGIAPACTSTAADATVLPFGVVMLAMLTGFQQGVDLIVRPGLCACTDVGSYGFRVIDRLLDKRRSAPALGVNDTVFRSLYPSTAFSTDPFLRFVRVFKFTFCHLFKIGYLG